VEAEADPATSGETSAGITAKVGDWALTLYGYASLNAMHDSTQSFSTAAGNSVIARRGTFRGNYDQMQFSVADSRVGLRVAVPPHGRVKASANLEMDFGALQPMEATEQARYVLSGLRMRHYYLRVDTPVVDVLAGQYHDLLGWGGKGFYPSTLAFLGITGQIYHRQPQLRLSKTISTRPIELELAVAALRPAQRASGTPDVQGGLRLAFNGLTGVRQQAYGQPGIGPMAIGVSGTARRFEVAQFLEFPGGSNVATGWGAAVNAFLPIIPASAPNRRANSLSVTAEFSRGSGISDLYTDLTGGALFPTLTNPQDRQQPTNPPPLYIPNIDSGIVTYDADGNLRTIDWQGLVVGLQYYFPFWSGRVWVSGNHSRVSSGNIIALTPIPGLGGVYSRAEYYDANLFLGLTPALQTGISFQSVQQTFGDGVTARNYRSAFAMHLYF
jgi:hypothetical protein